MLAFVALAPGFEIAEAMVPIDILKRARVTVRTISITDDLVVPASCGVQVVADALLADTDLSDGDLLMLPGGMPGSYNLADCQPLQEVILAYHQSGKWLCAICAAPLVYGRLGLLEGLRATCYPGQEHELTGAIVEKKTCITDGQFITACGAGAAYAFGHAMATALVGQDTADAVLRQMMFQVYE